MQDQFDYRRSNGYSVGRGRHPARVRRAGASAVAAQHTSRRANPAERGWFMMCTPDGAGCALAALGGGLAGAAALQAGRGFASVADALRVARAAAGVPELPGRGRPRRPPPAARPWRSSGRSPPCSAPPTNGILRRFDAGYDHDADGYATSAAWLAAKNRLGRRDAKAAVRQMRLLARHPPPRRRHRHRGAHDLVGAGDRRLDRPDRPRRTPGRGRQDPRRRGRRRGGPRRPASSSRRPPTRRGAPRSPTPTTTPAAAGSATGTCASRRPWTGPGGSGAT